MLPICVHIYPDQEMNVLLLLPRQSDTYLIQIDCSVQECVYHLLPEQWFERTFPRVIFANSIASEKSFCIFHSKNEIIDLSEDSEDILIT